MNHYPVKIFWSEEDEGFIALVPDLPGCSAWGATEDEALKESHDAIAAWIEAARSAGKSIPGPSNPADEMSYSGKFLMRVPKQLHAELSRQAKAQGVSLNQYVLYLLSKRNTENMAA